MSLSELSGVVRQHYLAYSSSMDQLAGLTEEARKLALDRFRLIKPHLEQNQSLQSVADAAGVPYRTAQRWVAQYRLFGLVAGKTISARQRGRPNMPNNVDGTTPLNSESDKKG